MAFAAAVVPMMLLHRFQQWGLSHEMMILAGAGVYLFIRFGGAALLRRYTVHRGMFHSLPAALVFGEIAFLLASGDDVLRLYKAGAVVLGYMISPAAGRDVQHRVASRASALQAVLRHGAETVRPRLVVEHLGLRQAGPADVR